MDFEFQHIQFVYFEVVYICIFAIVPGIRVFSKYLMVRSNANDLMQYCLRKWELGGQQLLYSESVRKERIGDIKCFSFWKNTSFESGM